MDAQLPQGLRGGGAFISPLKSNFLVGDPQGDSYRCFFSACSAWRSTWSSVGLLFVERVLLRRSSTAKGITNPAVVRSPRRLSPVMTVTASLATRRNILFCTARSRRRERDVVDSAVNHANSSVACVSRVIGLGAALIVPGAMRKTNQPCAWPARHARRTRRPREKDAPWHVPCTPRLRSVKLNCAPSASTRERRARTAETEFPRDP